MKPREFILPSGTKVIVGKDAKTNEIVVDQALPNEYLFHTKEKGSPFSNIKGKPKIFSRDIKNTAIITAKYSQDWRDNKSDVIVHYFKKKDVYKNKNMKIGTFGVKNFKEIRVKKKDIEKFIEKNLNF